MTITSLTISFGAILLITVHILAPNQLTALQSTIMPTEEQTSTPTSTELHDMYDEGMNDGREQLWSIVNLSIYDMYTTCDIVDFETQKDELSSRMLLLIEDEEYLEKCRINYKEYIDMELNDDDDN